MLRVLWLVAAAVVTAACTTTTVDDCLKDEGYPWGCTCPDAQERFDRDFGYVDERCDACQGDDAPAECGPPPTGEGDGGAVDGGGDGAAGTGGSGNGGAGGDGATGVGGDGAVDGSLDGGACGGACPARLCVAGACVTCVADGDCGEQVCNDDNACVDCVGHGDCTDPGKAKCGAEQTCVACDAPLQCEGLVEGEVSLGLCDAGQCVQCLGHGGCLDASQAKCGSDGRCTGCDDTAQCSGMGKVCEDGSGVCVQCTPASEATSCPGGEACHPGEYTCSGAQRGTLSFCQRCVSDSECLAASGSSGVHRCVPLGFGQPLQPLANYCVEELASRRDALDNPTEPCPNRVPEAELLTSVLGEAADYCVPKQSLYTCDAVRSFQDVCSDPGDCGADGADDGLCHSLTCTYRCEATRDCASSSSCVGSAGSEYCDP